MSCTQRFCRCDVLQSKCWVLKKGHVPKNDSAEILRISHDFVECGGGVFHVLSYHTCKTYNIPILDRGIYVAQSGFSFGLQIPVSAVITSVAQKKVTSLSDFETALAGVPNKEA